ncbi:hypothetical protein [Carnimonas nigrificans]|uniref:hypothetical protein n=1 Tax=Carnimonas nigrificans TaxID=64323 RepID=UPI0012EC9528|nr:hypothetical protein [Carnimonas nigrificans]
MTTAPTHWEIIQAREETSKESDVVNSLEYQIEAALNVYCMPEMLAQDACTHALHLLSDTHGRWNAGLH